MKTTTARWLRWGIAAGLWGSWGPSNAWAHTTSSPTTSEIAVTKSERAPISRRNPAHRGFIIDAATGTLGCTRAICAGVGGYHAQPGIFAGGFVGGNIGGFVELGISGGWGQLRSRASAGQNPASYWGVPSESLQGDLQYFPVFDRLMQAQTHDVKLSALNVAPMLRVHFVPAGRAIAYVGAGAGYGGLRSEHDTNIGRLRTSAHGIAVPVEAGLGLHVSKNVALVARFDYVWMHYLLLAFDHGQDAMVLPTTMADNISPRGSMQERLPHFWTISFGLRLRMF